MNQSESIILTNCLATEIDVGQTHDPGRDLLQDISGLKEQKSHLSSVMAESLGREFRDGRGHVPCHMEKTCLYLEKMRPTCERK